MITVDIDGTIVNTVELWKQWIETKTNKKIDFSIPLEYQNIQFDIMEFWRNPKLYDNLKPYDDVIDTLNILSKKYKINFVSQCVDEHINSKINFLQKWFKFDFSFYNEKYKEKIPSKIVIDDRNYVLDRFNNIIKIKPNTSLEKDKKYKILSWKEIKDIL